MSWTKPKTKADRLPRTDYQKIHDIEDADLIRALLRLGEHRATLARQYFITKREIVNIEKYRTWKPRGWQPGHEYYEDYEVTMIWDYYEIV